MKYYLVIFSDYSETIGTFKNKTEALKAGRLYCRLWDLSETVKDVKEITEEEYNARNR